MVVFFVLFEFKYFITFYKKIKLLLIIMKHYFLVQLLIFKARIMVFFSEILQYILLLFNYYNNHVLLMTYDQLMNKQVDLKLYGLITISVL